MNSSAYVCIYVHIYLKTYIYVIHFLFQNCPEEKQVKSKYTRWKYVHFLSVVIFCILIVNYVD
jgi:hypothetical protein